MISPESTALSTVFEFALGILVCSTVIRIVALRKAGKETRRKRYHSLATWWGLTLTVSAAIAAGRYGVCLLFFVVSCIALREYMDMILPKETRAGTLWVLYVLSAINYLLAAMGLVREFQVFIPLSLLLVLPTLRLITDNPTNYIRNVAAVCFGVLTLVYGLSHAVLPFAVSGFKKGPAGPYGWFLYLIILTELNDIVPALVGRKFSTSAGHRVSPRVSPNKTWEGLVAGFLVVTILAVALQPWFITFDKVETRTVLLLSILTGFVTSLAGFFGDINMSSVKRDAGVKDSGRMLPGMGGIIDRIDSLSFSSPVFVYFVLLTQRLATVL